MPEIHAPAVILVKPQLGENIGAVARAMSNFGLGDLRLVAPKNGWPNPRAVDMAAGGAFILDKARVYGSLEEALHGIHFAYATTARARDMEKRVIAPAAAATEWHRHAAAGRCTALLFGPERTGLENEHLVRCEAAIRIPTDAANPSLNLSQAAVIMAYEWCRLRADVPPPERAAQTQAPAAGEELNGLFTQLEEYLDAVNHFRTADKKPVMWQHLRALFTRAQLSTQEVRTLRGVMRALYSRRQDTPPP